MNNSAENMRLSEAQIESLVRVLVAEALGEPVESVQLTMTMYDTPKWDSLAHIKIVCAMEQLIGSPLSLDEIIASVSIGDWVKVAQLKLKNQNP